MASPNNDLPQSSPPQTGRSRQSSNATGEDRPRAGSDASIGRSRASTGSSGRLRSGSLRFLESSPGSGWWQATGEKTAKAPTPGEIRAGGYTKDGWHEEGQMEHRGHTPHQIVGMQQRRLSRINSGLTRTGTNILSPTTPALEESQEEHQYDFPTTREGQSRAQSTQRPLSKEEIAQVPTADKPVTEVIETPTASPFSLSSSTLSANSAVEGI
jgi:hypothetical protein